MYLYFCTNALEKGTNPSVLLPTMSKYESRLISLVSVRKPREEKLNSNQLYTA